MDLAHLATAALGIGLALAIVTSWRRRTRLELRHRILELIGAATRRGLPLAPALRRLGEATADPRGGSLRELADRLEAGEPFAAACDATLPRDTLPAETLAMIRATEGTAAMPGALARLAPSVDPTRDAHARVAVALAYPTLLALALIGTYATTRILLDELPRSATGSGGMAVFGEHVAAIMLWAGLGIVIAVQCTGLRGRMAGALPAAVRCLPGFRRILWIHGASQVLRTAAALSAAALPLGEILRRAAHTTSDRQLHRAVLRAARAADEGRAPAEVWQQSGLPEFAIAFASAGSGTAPAEFARRLHRAASACDRRVERGVTRAIAVLQPAAIAVFGVLIAIHFATVIQHVQWSRSFAGGSPW